MNEVINIIKSRRSVRKWQNKEVPQELIDEILLAALAAPTTHSSELFELIVVDKPELIKELLSDRLQLKTKPHWINSRKWATINGLENYEEVKEPPLLVIICGDKSKCPDLESLIASTSCAAENILIATHSIGLGSVWLYVRDNQIPETEAKVKQILAIPDNQLVLCMIATGYPDESPEPKVFDKSKIHNNKW